MRIGIFDSGLGGLSIAKSIRTKMPQYDLVYLGDTLHVPYGSRSKEAVFAYTHKSMEYLFREQDCRMVIMACNTASALTLRTLQQGWLKETYPERRILGVVVPTLEEAIERGHQRIGILATERIVESGVYPDELLKLDPGKHIVQQAATMLVPAIESGSRKWLRPLLEDYLAPLLKEDIQCLILGCTHYTLLRNILSEILPGHIDVITQDEIIPPKLIDYLERHPETDSVLSKSGEMTCLVTDVTSSYKENAALIFDNTLDIQEARL